ncbi:MAG: glycosyltransferase family 4 protein [Blastocatellales bacterium]
MAKEIVFIAGKDPCSEAGGHSSFVRSTARAAAGAGFIPHIFCVARKTEVVSSDFGMIHRIASPLRSSRQISVPFQVSSLAAGVERFLTSQQSAGKQGPHLIHSLSLWGYAGALASGRLRRLGHRVFTVVNSYTTMEDEAMGKLKGLGADHGASARLQHWAEYVWFKLIGRYERRVYLESDLTLVNYESVRRMLVEKYGSDLKIRKLAYAAESAFLQRPLDESLQTPEPLAALRPSGAPLIVSVSRHDPRKGVDVLLRALAELRDRGAQFRACILSGGQFLAAHRRLAERLGLGETTVLTGWVDDPTLYLRFADIFALPSLQEGSGSVSLLEAMQAGAAIVASKVDGICEDVADGESALLVEPGDVGSLSRALERLINDAALRSRLAGRARETFVERFSAKTFTRELGALYAELGF